MASMQNRRFFNLFGLNCVSSINIFQGGKSCEKIKTERVKTKLATSEILVFGKDIETT